MAPQYLQILMKDAALDAKVDIKQVTEGANASATEKGQTSFNFKAFGMEN